MPEHALSAAESEHLRRIVEARHHDPFAWLGRHPEGPRCRVRCFQPRAEAIEIETLDGLQPMQRIEGTDVFVWSGDDDRLPPRYRLLWHDAAGQVHPTHDTYSFAPVLGDLDLHLLGEGRHWHIYRMLGAHRCSHEGVEGVRFATWAPSAERVSVVGEFNHWDGRQHPMRVRGGSGVWELFVPGLGTGQCYKFEVRNRDSGAVVLKSDPYANAFERRPDTASRVAAPTRHQWTDSHWIDRRAGADWLREPMSVYEVHLGSWRRRADGEFLSYAEIAEQLVPYVKDMGFTHVELLPVAEHPLDASWGYQVTGYYAPTSRFGDPDEFRGLVDAFHRNGIGVLLDWVPGHFPRDEHGLARFDGTALYEHEDPRRGEHRDWGTLIFNYGRNEVRNFLLANAVYWIEEFHIDGLRVDAVASMLYLDYSRESGDWIPNQFGGRENLEAIDFLRELNTLVHREFPGVLVMAEESTAWPQVSRPIEHGGLGFSMKWNMGWMNDTLVYFSKDSIYRRYHHEKLTFGLLYAFTENFILPFSHDEVVHGKRALLDKMPGDEWQKFANLRLLYGYQYSQPGRKLLFMGAELAQWQEWSEARELDWMLLDHATHRGVQQLLRDLNRVYREHPALHQLDFDAEGFRWLDADRGDESLLFYLRRSHDSVVLVALNFTPVPRRDLRVGVPVAGRWREILNTDSAWYGGGNIHNGDGVQSHPLACMGQPHSIEISLPPLAAVYLAPTG